MTHDLKTWPQFFEAVVDGSKPFEIRREDGRTFLVGDFLKLNEFEPCVLCNATGRVQSGGGDTDACSCMATAAPKGRYTGRYTLRLVTYTTEFGQPEGQVVLGISPLVQPL